MASILDVARVAKVSPSTVSLVVNHRHRVSPTTRKRVEAVIRRLGYRGRDGRALAGARRPRALRLGFIYTPDALIDGAETTYTRQLIAGIEQSLMGSASSLNIMRGTNDVAEDKMFCAQLDAGEFDGLLIVGPQPGDGYIERITAKSLPLVVFNRPTDRGLHSVVTLDYTGGGDRAIDHLVSLGHRRIGILLRSEAARWPGKVLYDGCVAALRRRGLEPAADEVIPLDNWKEGIRDICRRMVDAGVTAIQTGDVQGVNCLDALEDFGLVVPDDISVMGFDDRGRTGRSGLMLTGIGYDKIRMGRMAGRMIQRLTQPSCALKWLGAAVKTHFVNGQTTAAPKGERTASL